QGIDCNHPAAVPAGYAECCNPDVPRTIQERAWSSPIWYRPEGVAHVRGVIRFRDPPRLDALTLGIDLGAMPAGLDPSTQALTIALRDDDDIYRVTVPAGTLRQVRPRQGVLNDARGSIGGIRRLRLQQRGARGVLFRLRTVPVRLSGADRVEHFIEISLGIGTAAVTATPLWHFDGKSLVTKN